MKNDHHRHLVKLLALILGIGAFLVINSISDVSADDVDDETIKNAPAGLNISQYFENGLKTDDDIGNEYYPYRENYATTDGSGKVLILASGNNAGYEHEIKEKAGLITLTKGRASNISSYGAMWSKATADNYIDTKSLEPQQITAWIYSGADTGNTNKDGQGLAFAIQNDPTGIDAIGAGQEGLGLYGFDEFSKAALSSSSISTDEIAKTAVQNSVAIEFDAQINKFSPLGKADGTDNGPVLLVTEGLTKHYTLNGYDTAGGLYTVPDDYPDRGNTKPGAGGGYGHIAFTYPSNPESYVKSTVTNGMTLADWGYSLYHIKGKETTIINDSIEQDNWHHVTITWQNLGDGTATLKYAFNDKSRDGTYNDNLDGNLSGTFQRSEGETTVSLSTFGDIKDNKLLWGFTGANSSVDGVQSKLVDFESIPALLSVEPDTYIVDNTLQKTIIADTDGSVDNDKTVNRGDELELHYDLSYLSGRRDWSDIEAAITLPDHFEIKPDSNGNVAKITFSDGTAPEYITAGELKDSTISHAIKKAMSASNNLMGVVITGTAINDTKEAIDVDSAGAKFSSDINITTTSTPKFTIDPRKPWNLTLSDPEDIDLLYQPENPNASLNLPTSLSYDGDHNFSDNSEILYKIEIGNNTYTSKATTTSKTSTADITIPLKDVIDVAATPSEFWDIFNPDAAQPVKVKVTAYDEDSVASNTVTYNVKVTEKYLELTSSNDLEFQDITNFDTKKVLKRKNDFQLDVTSYNSAWKLTGKSTSLKDDDNDTFNGNVFYKDPETGVSDNMNNEDAPIESSNQAVAGKVVTSIDDEWNADNGILLSQLDYNSEGAYSGKITWTLSDTP